MDLILEIIYLVILKKKGSYKVERKDGNKNIISTSK